jgi:hypothetical protein
MVKSAYANNSRQEQHRLHENRTTKKQDKREQKRKSVAILIVPKVLNSGLKTRETSRLSKLPSWVMRRRSLRIKPVGDDVVVSRGDKHA